MNTKGNQRYENTELKIRQVFQELLGRREIQEITVSEICKRAQIHRTTFYAHYLDIYDLMEHMVKEMYQDFMNRFLDHNQLHLRDGFLHLFSFIQENCNFFQSFMIISRQQNHIPMRLPESLEKNIDEIMKGLNYTSKQELLYHQAFFCQGLIAIIQLWIDGGCQEMPEYLYQIIEDEYRRKEFLVK